MYKNNNSDPMIDAIVTVVKAFGMLLTGLATMRENIELRRSEKLLDEAQDEETPS